MMRYKNAKKALGLTILICVGLAGVWARYQRDLRLLDACGRGNLIAVKQQLDHGANPDAQPYYFTAHFMEWLDGQSESHLSDPTPLMVAVANSNTALTKLLLERGANPNIKCYYDRKGGEPGAARSPLQYVRIGNEDAEIERLLLVAGAKE